MIRRSLPLAALFAAALGLAACANGNDTSGNAANDDAAAPASGAGTGTDTGGDTTGTGTSGGTAPAQ